MILIILCTSTRHDVYATCIFAYIQICFGTCSFINLVRDFKYVHPPTRKSFLDSNEDLIVVKFWDVV
jgi:hypothetical protein